MTDYKKLCEDLGKPIETMDVLDEVDIMEQAADAIEKQQLRIAELERSYDKMLKDLTLRTEQVEQLQPENERLKKQLAELRENFVDYACSGVTNLNPYCVNRTEKCTDMRSWCIRENCIGFSPACGDDDKGGDTND